MGQPVDVSRAEAGEIADSPGSDDIFNATLRNQDREKTGYLIKWKTSKGAYFMASDDSHVSLDAMM